MVLGEALAMDNDQNEQENSVTSHALLLTTADKQTSRTPKAAPGASPEAASDLLFHL
jgi:hypothetical protein